MAQIIKVGFCGFGENFRVEEFPLAKLMSSKYIFQLSDNPDYLFSHRASHGKRGNLGAFLMLKQS